MQSDSKQISIFFDAIQNHNMSEIDALLTKTPSLLEARYLDSDGKEMDVTPARWAMIYPDVFEYFLKKGAKVTPDIIIDASSEKDQVLLLLALKYGAAVDARNDKNDFPLMAATRIGNLQNVEILLARGANVNLQDADGDTALHEASKNGDTEIMDILFAHAVNAAIQNSAGKTAADVAATDAMRKKLLDYGNKRKTPPPSMHHKKPGF